MGGLCPAWWQFLVRTGQQAHKPCCRRQPLLAGGNPAGLLSWLSV
jgi:hypothetical protein